MYRKALSRRSLGRTFVLAASLAALILSTAPASAQCSIVAGVNNVSVELMSPPTAASGLSANQRTLMRREHAHVSSTLADLLALDGLIDSDPFAPNPQVRVVIEDPDPIDGRRSFAIFTVTEIFESQDLRIRVFAQDGAGDDDSGEFKLFADRAATGGVQTFSVNQGGFLDGTLSGVWARVLVTPVSSSTVSGGTPFSADYCESSGTGYEEEAVVAAGADVALLAPHGGAIELKTSDQLDVVESELAAQGVVANVWDVHGSWGRSQTFQRLHVTAPSFYTDSYPGLRQLMDKTDYSTGLPFRFSVALHGYGGSQKGIILGGRADREAKCLVAARIQDELEAARGDRDEIGFRIFDDAEGDLTVASSSGHVPPDQHGGQSADNIVNRLSPNPLSLPGWGGIQIEQSSGVRNDTTNPGNLSPSSDGWLRNVVSRGVAQALIDLLAYDDDQGPTGICSSL